VKAWSSDLAAGRIVRRRLRRLRHGGERRESRRALSPATAYRRRRSQPDLRPGRSTTPLAGGGGADTLDGGEGVRRGGVRGSRRSSPRPSPARPPPCARAASPTRRSMSSSSSSTTASTRWPSSPGPTLW
jgi:hypothetical protein